MGESRSSVILGDMGHCGGVAGTVILRLMGEGSGGTVILGVSYPEGMLSTFQWKCYVLYSGSYRPLIVV